MVSFRLPKVAQTPCLAEPDRNTSFAHATINRNPSTRACLRVTQEKKKSLTGTQHKKNKQIRLQPFQQRFKTELFTGRGSRSRSRSSFTYVSLDVSFSRKLDQGFSKVGLGALHVVRPGHTEALQELGPQTDAYLAGCRNTGGRGRHSSTKVWW